MKTCCYCKEEFDDEECRPYGPMGTDACYPCAMLPENEATTKREFNSALDIAIRLGKGAIYIGHHSGPLPASIGDTEKN